MTTRALRLLLACALLGAPGCTLLVDDEVGSLQPDPRPDIEFSLAEFDPHIGQLTEIRFVNAAGNIEAVAIYDGLPMADLTLLMHDTFRADLRRVDFYSDLNENRMIDMPDVDPIDMTMEIFPDHMWRTELDEQGVGGFTHSTNFTDIVRDDPATFSLRPFQLNVTGADPFLDQTAELRIIDPLDRDVGFYRLFAVTSDTLAITIPGVIDDGSEYRVRLEIGDEAFCTSGAGDSSGLTISGSIESALSGCTN